MEDKVTLSQKFTLLDKPYSPGIVGYLNIGDVIDALTVAEVPEI